ncbi:MAG: FAD-dependent oxidoreductase [Pseudomonadota bacterium]|nr:FAD-dependent oxidoreductase [Pseudomonadota bacterium]
MAVVGSGIAGLGAAWRLSCEHEVVLFESADRLGGHVHTHEVELEGRRHAVDTGFIVFNHAHYPLLTALFAELGVATQPTTMSFSVQDARNGLEYNAADLDGLFAQRRNLLSPRFWGMLRDLRRFYREAPALFDIPGDGPGLGAYLDDNDYGQAFAGDHLVPMAAALWSSPAARVLDFPAKFLVRFMQQHQMLQVEGRPEWRVVRGGSRRYVDALQSRWQVQTRLSCHVHAVSRRHDGRVDVSTSRGTEIFDEVVLACHGDDALALVDAPSAEERAVLGAIAYQDNDTVLHTDARLLPQGRKAWAAWNAYVPAGPGESCTVSYCMNLLQGIDSAQPLVVSLNRTLDIAADHILARMRYRHPVHTPASVAAQARVPGISGRDRLWYAGAWCGFGFHEDGLRSGYAAADGLLAMLRQRQAA